jgi:hypothetical protein
MLTGAGRDSQQEAEQRGQQQELHADGGHCKKIR